MRTLQTDQLHLTARPLDACRVGLNRKECAMQNIITTNATTPKLYVQDQFAWANSVMAVQAA
jgi:hypothetical protein